MKDETKYDDQPFDEQPLPDSTGEHDIGQGPSSNTTATGATWSSVLASYSGRTVFADGRVSYNATRASRTAPWDDFNVQSSSIRLQERVNGIWSTVSDVTIEVRNTITYVRVDPETERFLTGSRDFRATATLGSSLTSPPTGVYRFVLLRISYYGLPLVNHYTGSTDGELYLDQRITLGSPSVSSDRILSITATMQFGPLSLRTITIGNDLPVIERSGSTANGWFVEEVSRRASRTTTVISYRAIPWQLNAGGTYDFTVAQSRYASGLPQQDTSQSFSISAPPSFSAYWVSPTGTPLGHEGPRIASARLLLSAASSNLTASDIIIQRAGAANTWTTESGWTITFNPSNPSSSNNPTVFAEATSGVAQGSFRFVLQRRALGTNPTSDVVSDPFSIRDYVGPTFRWSDLTTDSDRSATATLHFPSNPGSAFNPSNDIRIDRQNNDDTWSTSTGWTVTSTGSGMTRTIKATSATTVLSGTYRMVIVEDAVGTNLPSSDTTSGNFQIPSYVVPYISSATWSNEAGGLNLSARLTFTGSAVYGIEPNDFEIINSSNTVDSRFTISPSASSTTSFVTITATPNEELWGDYRIRLKANSVRGGSTATDNSPSSTVTSSSQRINSVVDLEATWSILAFCAGSNSLTATLNFNSAVNNPGTSDIQVQLYNSEGSHTNVNNWTIVVTEVEEDQYTITLTPPVNINRVVRLRLKRNTISFRANPNTITGPSDDIDSQYVAVDNRLGTGGEELAAFWSNMVGGPTLSGRITFTGQDVTGIASTDFEARTLLGAATAVTITVEDDEGNAVTQRSAGQSAIVTATPSSTYRIDGQLFLRLKQNSLMIGTESGPQNHVDSDLTPLNTFTVWGDPTGGTALIATMTFGADINRITTSDFEVIDETDVVQGGWTITFSPVGITSRTNGQTLDVICTPPSNTADIFRIRLKAASLQHGSAGNDSVPAVATITKRARVNNIDTMAPPPIEEAPYLQAISLPTGVQTGTSVTITIDAKVAGVLTNITGLRSDDFKDYRSRC